MFVLGFLTLASTLGCCIGFTIIQRPAEQYDSQNINLDYQLQPLPEYQWKPMDYQWQPLDYQEHPYHYQFNNYQYNSYQPSSYQPSSYQPYYYKPYDYQPYDYKPYDYQPSYPKYFYYPLYQLSFPYGYETKPRLPHVEAQQLLQVYRLIRVIVVFRDPLPNLPVTSLDRLIQQLSDDALQQKLVELLCNEPGYGEVAELTNDPAVKLTNSFVNDYRRLLLALQRAFNDLDLTTELDHDLYEKLRMLRDQANALTVEQIDSELLRGMKGQAKEAVVSDVLENLLGEVEAKDLEEFHENYGVLVEGEDGNAPLELDKVEKYLVVIVDPEGKVQQEPKNDQNIDDETLDDLAAALELYLEEQKLVESSQVKEKSISENEQLVEPETTVASTTTVYTTTEVPKNPVEAAKDTWLGSILGKGNILPVHYERPSEVPESQKLPQPIDVSQPAVLVEPEEIEANKLDNQNVWVHQEKPDEDTLDFDIDQRFQAPSVASTEKVNTVTHSVPLWLIENAKNQKVESKQVEIEDIIEDQDDDEGELLRQLPDGEDEQEIDDIELELEDLAESRTESDDEVVQRLLEKQYAEREHISVNTGEVEARMIPVVEELEQEGPARFDLPVDLPVHQQLNTSPEPMTIKENEKLKQLELTTDVSITTVAEELTALNIYKVHTESTLVESREESSVVVQKATSELNAQRFVREEVLKVLNLLEESNGFPELKESITEDDLNELVEELGSIQVGVRWTEMISALQKMIQGKKISSSDRIVEILENWKQGEEGHLDDGYFDRTYGKEEQMENRQLEEDIDEIDLEQAHLDQLQAAILESSGMEEGDRSEAITKRVLFVDSKDSYFETAYNQPENQSLPLNGSDAHELVQLETDISTESSSTENRNARILNVDSSQNSLENSTQNLLSTEKPFLFPSFQAEEVTNKLDETTTQPFPVNET